MDKIVYTLTDEAPMLATYSLLPIINRFTKPAGVDVETSDISVSGRILSQFPERLKPEQFVPDNLAKLGVLAKTPAANIVKLPNISASAPQLTAAISELQSQGYDIPDYPADPKNDEEAIIKEKYASVLGSAVNPVLREGNSDRRVAGPVKVDGQAKPHRMMKPFPSDSRSSIAFMRDGDFYSSEQSVVMPAEATTLSIQHVAADGTVTPLKSDIPIDAKEVVDCSVMHIAAFRQYVAEEIQRCKDEDVLMSLHLKATMMKVSDPVMFGHAVEVFYEPVFTKYAALFQELGVNPNNGLGDVYRKVAGHAKQAEVEADIAAVYGARPRLAMVDSSKGITNLHTPSDVIVDASMAVVVRDGGKMWGTDDQLHDTRALVPDRCYARMYQTVLDNCRQNGAFDPATMGSMANVGLMAQKAEEYGSHPTTFIQKNSGVVQIVDASGDVVMEQVVAEGDIWRMCRTKDEPIKDWVKLAVTRARITGDPAVFWLDDRRAHDRNIIAKVNEYLPAHNTEGLSISIMNLEDAMEFTCNRLRAGGNAITCTGNVMRDYLTDLFPIMELGTSAKMLSIVPLLAGGGLYETGAGGSAPKHIQQFLQEGHLRWDSLGEFLALAASLEDLGEKKGCGKTKLLGATLNEAVGGILSNSKSPARKVGQLDNRGSHFYLALYWAQALAAQQGDPELAAEFTPVAAALSQNEEVIVEELLASEGSPKDIGGYYRPDPVKTEAAMRPSATLNSIINAQ